MSPHANININVRCLEYRKFVTEEPTYSLLWWVLSSLSKCPQGKEVAGIAWSCTNHTFYLCLDDYCGLTIYFPSYSNVDILMPNVTVFEGETLGRCLGLEGGVFMNWISDSTETALPNLPCEDKARRYLLTRKRAFTEAQSCWHLDLGLISSQSYRKSISVFYTLPSLWYFVIAAWVDK